MYLTQFGPFNGKSWELLCQQVFKAKYGHEGYQPMPASPGDFGIEGYTAHTGVAFQCYCPEKQYSSADLYTNQRDKISADLAKLKKNVNELAKRLGDTKIKEWNFVTPTVDKNELLSHAKAKEAEVRAWALPILTPEFTVLLRDGDSYLKEINEIQSLNGEPLSFNPAPPKLEEITAGTDEHEENIERKTRLRVGASGNVEKRTSTLVQTTRTSFLEGSSFLASVERAAPTVYFRLLRLINEYERQVHDSCATWSGTPEELTIKIRTELEARILSDLGPKIDSTTAAQISRHMIARWLAVCQLDFD
jgi:hypothetical protein